MEGWGIYDDSVKLERAIEVSDAYYGDPSSVVRLFQEVGKDILIQNLDFTNVIEQQIVSAEAISEAEDGYWFVPFYGRTLFKMNKYTYEIDVVAHLDEEREAALYLGVFEYREKLFLLPKTAEKIAVYDTFSVSDKVKEIFKELVRKPKFVFGKLFSIYEKPKAEVVTAFSGVLELSRRNKINAYQEETFGDIVISKRKKENNLESEEENEFESDSLI